MCPHIFQLLTVMIHYLILQYMGDLENEEVVLNDLKLAWMHAVTRLSQNTQPIQTDVKIYMYIHLHYVCYILLFLLEKPLTWM